MTSIAKVTFVVASVFSLTLPANAQQLLRVKYRQTLVDVDRPYFEHLDTSNSSWVQGAWYDASNKYMIINLSGTNYQYCGLNGQTWKLFKSAESFGRAYIAKVKGKFDCRIFPVPTYSGK